MKIYNHSEKGIKRYENCDYMLSKVEESYYILVLADGAQEGEIARKGVEKIASDLTECVANNIEKYLNMSEELIRHQVACCIMSSIQELKRLYRVDREIFASTFMLVCVYKTKKLVIHIGDGIIGEVGSTGVQIVSEPENGIGKEFTFMTTSPSMPNRLRVSLSETKELRTIFMLTDGCCDQVYRRGVKLFDEWFVEKIFMGNYNGIVEEIRMSESEDDWSFLCLEL